MHGQFKLSDVLGIVVQQGNNEPSIVWIDEAIVTWRGCTVPAATVLVRIREQSPAQTTKEG